jgi:hypothetical protein
VTHLLQAEHWYGIFLYITTKRFVTAEEEGLPIHAAHIHAMARPLVGWTTAEGGFQGLYYYERDRRLATAIRIEQGGPIFPSAEDETLVTAHLGDIAIYEAIAVVQKTMREAIIRRAAQLEQQYISDHRITLSQAAQSLLRHHVLPIVGD